VCRRPAVQVILVYTLQKNACPMGPGTHPSPLAEFSIRRVANIKVIPPGDRWAD
jgi:hypothetical protein